MLIDNELKTLIPPLSEEEYKGLEESIIAEGVRESLIVWDAPDGNRYLVDGHNRYEIAQKHNLPYNVRRMEFADKGAVIQWMILNQFNRRNLSKYDRSLLALKLKPVIQEKAKEQQVRKSVSQISVEQKPIDTQKELAKVAGVSHDTIHKVEVIEKKAPESVKAKVKTGEMTINSAYLQVKADESPIKTRAQIEREELKQAKKEHTEFNEAKKESIVSIADMKADKENLEMLAQDMAKQIRLVESSIRRLGLLKPSEINSYMNTFSDYGRNDLADRIDCCIGILQIFKEGAENGKN